MDDNSSRSTAKSQVVFKRDVLKRDKEDMTLASLLKLLADDHRLAIVELLRGRSELNVSEFCEMLDQSQPAVSHHLAQLRRAGLLETRRSGKHRFYRIRRRAWRHVEFLLGSLIFEPAATGPSRPDTERGMSGPAPSWMTSRLR